MIKKFSEALGLLGNNLGLFTLIVLTVWLPGNLLAAAVAYKYPDAGVFSPFKLTLWIEIIFGPLCSAALIYALSRRKRGESVTYRDAMTVGVKNWWPVFAANLAAEIRVLLGFFALVVPGIILSVRYSLIDAAVVLENKDTFDSRARSAELTSGRRWRIFFASLFFYTTFFLLAFALYALSDIFASLNTIPVEVFLDCILDIVFMIIDIVMFLFYWESVNAPAPAGEGEGVVPVVQP